MSKSTTELLHAQNINQQQLLEFPSPSQIVFNLRGWNPRPAFRVESEWLPRIFCLNMEPHWKKVLCHDRSCDYRGTSYFLLPASAPDATYSAHFDPTSPYFHSFFGVYIIPPVNGQRVSSEVLSELGNRDNLAWLRMMGDPFPFSVPIEAKCLECVETDELGRGKKWSFLTTYLVHGDLGHNVPQEGLPPFLIAPKATAKGSWEQFINSYQEMVITSRGFIWYEENYLILNFFNGIEFCNKTGRKIDTYHYYPKFRQQLLRMADGLKIINDGTGFSCPPPGKLTLHL